jgi:hypothetical protein
MGVSPISKAVTIGSGPVSIVDEGDDGANRRQIRVVPIPFVTDSIPGHPFPQFAHQYKYVGFRKFFQRKWKKILRKGTMWTAVTVITQNGSWRFQITISYFRWKARDFWAGAVLPEAASEWDSKLEGIAYRGGIRSQNVTHHCWGSANTYRSPWCRSPLHSTPSV